MATLGTASIVNIHGVYIAFLCLYARHLNVTACSYTLVLEFDAIA
jgi:hypothetical protein